MGAEEVAGFAFKASSGLGVSGNINDSRYSQTSRVDNRLETQDQKEPSWMSEVRSKRAESNMDSRLQRAVQDEKRAILLSIDSM
jgi:hypothetical protein